LFAIAHNVITDDLRARRPVAPMTAAAHLAAPDPLPEEVVLTNETGGLVHALLGSLPADQRQILELRLVGLTGPEIAEALGRSLGAIKIAQVRAFARLRATLDASSDAAKEGRQ
jgi:RNA polymerase sigma-70 factor (ECF subfamily)